MNKRKDSYKFNIGNKTIGGLNPILIQSMCNIKTSKTKEIIKQINECAKYGADLMRVSILDEDDAKALKIIKEHISIPIIADIHFSYKLAILSIKNGADKIRINPGNIGTKDNLLEIINVAKEYDIPIRIGVNSGSMDKNIFNYNRKLTYKDMVKSAMEYIYFFEQNDFHKLVISLKSSDVIETIKAYKLISKLTKYPLHIGITEAGPLDISLIRSTSTIAPLLISGLGNTIRYSITDDPTKEIIAARRLLNDLNLRKDLPILISCPTCGRTMVNLENIIKEIEPYLLTLNKQIKVAIMGCIVNGPGEAKNADIGIAGGNKIFVLFRNGKVVEEISEDKAVQKLKDEIHKLLN